MALACHREMFLYTIMRSYIYFICVCGVVSIVDKMNGLSENRLEDYAKEFRMDFTRDNLKSIH